MIAYNGWDRDYKERIDDYTAIFDQMMVKEYEGNTEFLEKQISEYTGRKYCVAVASATDALHFSLLSHGIGVGDQVLVSDFSWISTASCIKMVGASPVFCDIDLDTYHMSFEHMKHMYEKFKNQQNGVKALIYTHLFGNMTDTADIENFCKEHGIAFIEDSAQSLGSSLKGRKAGTIGDCSSYSFNANKVIAGISGGGMFMTDNEEQARMVSKLRRHGKDKDFEILGRNSKMFVPNADIISFRLEDMEEWQNRRQDFAAVYDEAFEGLVEYQRVDEGLNHNYHKYVIRFEDKETRKFVKENVKEKLGFSPSIHYEKALSDNPVFKLDKGWRSESVNAQIAADTVMSLPIHAWLTYEEVEQVADTVSLLI